MPSRLTIQRVVLSGSGAQSVLEQPDYAPVLLGSMDITDPANQASFSRSVVAGYTGATGSAFAFEADVDELRDAHHAGGSTGVLLEDSPTACVLPAPTNIVFPPNGINLNVTGDWDAVIGSVAKYQYRYDGAGTVFDVVPDDTATSLSTTGTAGTHTVDIRAVSPLGVDGAWGTSGSIVLVGGGGGGGPTMIAQDAFTRSDSPSLGANWTTGTASSAEILTNFCQGEINTETTSYWSADSFANDQYALAAVSNLNASTRYAGVGARLTGATSTLCGYVVFSDGTAGAGHSQIDRIDNGTRTTLTAVTATFSDADIIGIQCSGTTISFLKNGSVVTSATDATYASGSAGIFQYGQGRVDDWEGGNL